MLVRRAVLRARQRYALAGRPLACRGVAAQRRPVERDPLAFALVHVLRGDRHVLRDRRVDAQLRLDREVDAHVVEERACGSCEVVAVAREGVEGGPPRLQEEVGGGGEGARRGPPPQRGRGPGERKGGTRKRGGGP